MMCGIFGSSDFERFKTLYALNQDRGTFAFGGLFYSDEGYVSTKRPGIVDLDEFKNDFTYYLGHTQAPTSSQRNFTESTTHPFSVEGWSVAHNGVLSNDRELISKFDLHNVNEVDSSVIPALMEHNEITSAYNGDCTESAILETLEQLSGTFACWVVNQRSKNLYITRVGSTLFVNNRNGDFSSRKFENSKTVSEGILHQFDPDYKIFVPTAPYQYNSPYLIL